jgi:hypothetical protein
MGAVSQMAERRGYTLVDDPQQVTHSAWAKEGPDGLVTVYINPQAVTIDVNIRADGEGHGGTWYSSRLTRPPGLLLLIQLVQAEVEVHALTRVQAAEQIRAALMPAADLPPAGGRHAAPEGP